MTDEIWDKIIGDIQAMGYRNQVGLYLHHEPLLERTLFDKIRQINEETEAFVVISTNGSLLNEMNRKALIASRPRIVHININSAEKDQYEKMTGLSFETTIRQAKRFIAEAAGKVHVEINCPVLPEVDVEKLIGLFPGVPVNTDFWANSRGGLLEGISSKGKGSRFKISDYCLQPEQNFNILFDGSVVLCCNDWSHESKKDFPNVMDQSIPEIYGGILMHRIVEEFRGGDYGRYRICRHCAVEMGFIEEEKRPLRSPASGTPRGISQKPAKKPLSILLATNHLFGFTGSEITLFTIAKCLRERGHRVSVYAKYIDPRFTELFDGTAEVHKDMEALSRHQIDAAYVQHHTTALEVRYHFPHLPMVMASLGVLPFLEQPPLVDLDIHQFLAISEEVKANLIRKGVDDKTITIFRNIVDSRKFRPTGIVHQRPQSAFIYSYKMGPEQITTVVRACEALDIQCRRIGEKPGAIHQNDLASRLNEADIVFTLGRGAIETMMCGRIPIIFDYQGGDGMVTPDNIQKLMTCNFSGRLYRKNYSVEEMIDEIKKYNPENALTLQRVAIELFDAERGVGTLASCLQDAINASFGAKEPVARAAVESLVQIIGITREFTEATMAKHQAAAAPTSGIPSDVKTVQTKEDVSRNTTEQTDARLIAFYLPQYHPIPENDEWWGKGFTEWTNVAKAKPLFSGHYQPHRPGELGFYDLRLPEARKAQADLAREYGIHGFCYYHYWFNGKLLLDRPLQEILKSGEPDFPFCLCWANENWTRKWDGGENHILMEQKYSEEDDRQHIRYLCEIFRDRRYIRINGRPLFLVYRANRFPAPLKTTRIWREEARKLGIGEIYLCRVESFPDEHDDPKRIGFDAAVEFQPDWTEVGPYENRGKDIDYRIYDHRKVVDRMLRKSTPPYMRFPCVNPTWDNSPRRRDDITVFIESTPQLYETWLRETLKKWKPKDPEENIIFINAWNEWGEGNHLEPDEKVGRAYLEAQKNALQSSRKDERDPAAEAHEDILKLFVTEGKRAEAVFALERLVESFSDYSPAYNDLGVLYCEQGYVDKALAAYEKAVSLEPGNATFQKNLADFYYVAMKRPEAAVPHYENALSLDPRDKETLIILGNIQVESGNHRSAKDYYLRVLETEPSNELAGKMFDALEAWEQEFSGGDPEVLLREVRSLVQRGQTDSAIEKLETLLRFHPEEARAHNDLGNLYCLQKGIEKALFHLDRAAQLQPDVLRFVKDLADTVLAELGNVEEALKLYNRALALHPDDVATLLRIGNICAAQKQFDPARFFYGRVLSIEPGNAQAEENLSVLQCMVEEKSSFAEPLSVCQESERLIGEGGGAEGCTLSSKATHGCASIIIPVFNQVEFTARCLETLCANTPLDRVHEIIVVDNASSDGTGTFLVEARKRYPKLKVLTNRENLLFAKACNQGADAAGGDYLVFLNNDTEPLAGWLGNAIDRLESDDSIGILGIKLLYPDRTVQHCGIQFQRNAHPSYVVWPLHRYPHASADDPRVNVPQDVHAVTGACLFIRRDFFRRIGGFEERYRMYFEDTDLCFKARRGGKRVFYEPASVVIHHEGKSSASLAVINDLNTRAARLFFKIWKTELYSIELETLIDREEGKYAYLPDHFWPDEVSPEEIVRMHNLLSSFPSCHVHFGGSGDALLLLSSFYDSDPEQTIVSVSNSTGMMRSFFDAFSKLKKVYFIPFPKNYTWHYIARRFFKSSVICRGLGATPTTTADYKEWNADLDIFKTYGIRQRPAWAVNFGKNRLTPRQVTLQPRGSLKGMVGSKRNALSTQDWARLLSHLEKKGVRPVIIGTPDEAAEYPCLGNAIDKRSYSFAEQMKLIAASDFFIGADSWGKTFAALAGIPTFVFHALRGDDLKDWKDASDHVFLDPWDEITVVKDFKGFRKSFDDAWRDKFLSAADLKFRWEGSQFVHHSLALVNRELCLRLIEGGCEVSIVPYERDQFTPKDEPRFKPIAERTKKPLSGPADVHIRHQWPPNFTPPPEGHWVIIQPWEFGSIPREWVHNMSAHVDEVWVPSHYVRDCYIKSGVPSERVFVVPNGVDIRLFNPGNAPYPLKTKKAFKLLFVGGTIQRKGIDILLDVYTKTFTSGDDVCLVIKDMGGQTFYKGQTAKDWIGRFQADPGSPEIEYIEHTLSDREIAGLYTACDCLVHPYRGEGFGLPIAEAMASGLPVIVTGHGAALDFCDDKTAYLILAKEMRLPEKRIGEYDTVDFPWLAEPDKESLARLMRHAATHRKEAAAKGALAAEFIRANFTWDHAAEAVRKRVRELRGKPIVRLKRHEDSTSRKEGIHQELLSIIIPVSGEAPNIRNCVDSIRKWTPEPHEMVFVESEAASGVKKWLKKISQKDPLCRVVQTDGHPPPVSDPVRLGLRSCAGKYVAVVEPDIVVTEHWSAGMLEALESSADIGIVGPMMVNTEGRQNVPGAEGLSASNLELPAAAFQKQNRHRRVFSDRLSRSCMMCKRNLADEIGLTDDGQQREGCDPDEWCLRSIYSGYQNLIAGDVLVYRSGNGDCNGQEISCGATGERNLSNFAAKGGCLNAGTPEGKRFLAMLAFREATERFQQGDLKGATEACLEAIKLAPWKRGFYLALAEMLMQTKHFREALDLLRESDPGEQDERTVSLLGCIHEGLDEDEEAGRKADRALALSAHSARALNLKGVLAFKRGEAEHAKAFFKKADEADPSWGEPLTNLGVLLWSAGDRDDALSLVEKGFILSPHVEDIADRYHAASTSLEAFGRAEDLFREARGLYPSSRRIAFLLIDLLIRQEKHAAAMSEIEAAMAAFDVDDGFIAAALEVRGKIGPPEIKKKAKEKTLSLCMIVKNEQTNLVRCLSSIKAAVDEMIVVDTGSTDRTKELAAVFGAKVFDFDWDEDFSSARNFSLSKATGDWILVIDADETVSSRDHETIRDLILKSPVGTGGYYLTTRNYVVEANTAGWVANDGSYRDEDAGTGWYPNRKVRLFRNDPRIRFSGAVHELVEAAMQNAGMRLAECSVPIHHTGKLDRASVLEKGQRYYLLGLKKIEDTGGTPRAILELAIQAGELGRYDDAIRLWKRYLDGKPALDVKLAYVNLINACLNADRFDEALLEARKAAGQANGTRELLLNCAAAEFFAGDLRKAIRMVEIILRKDPDYPPALGLFAMSLALAGHEERGMGYLQRLCEQGLELRSQILPVIVKLRQAGKKDEADKLLRLLDRQPQVLPGPIEPSPDRSLQTGSHQALRGI